MLRSDQREQLFAWISKLIIKNILWSIKLYFFISKYAIAMIILVVGQIALGIWIKKDTGFVIRETKRDFSIFWERRNSSESNDKVVEVVETLVSTTNEQTMVKFPATLLNVII